MSTTSIDGSREHAPERGNGVGASPCRRCRRPARPTDRWARAGALCDGSSPRRRRRRSATCSGASIGDVGDRQPRSVRPGHTATDEPAAPMPGSTPRSARRREHRHHSAVHRGRGVLLQRPRRMEERLMNITSTGAPPRAGRQTQRRSRAVTSARTRVAPTGRHGPPAASRIIRPPLSGPRGPRAATRCTVTPSSRARPSLPGHHVDVVPAARGFRGRRGDPRRRRSSAEYRP
jgi:hypothetical protein